MSQGNKKSVKKFVGANLNEKEYQELKDFADREHRSISSSIKIALAKFLENQHV